MNLRGMPAMLAYLTGTQCSPLELRELVAVLAGMFRRRRLQQLTNLLDMLTSLQFRPWSEFLKTDTQLAGGMHDAVVSTHDSHSVRCSLTRLTQMTISRAVAELQGQYPMPWRSCSSWMPVWPQCRRLCSAKSASVATA